MQLNNDLFLTTRL